jgi:hypothetical protein
MQCFRNALAYFAAAVNYVRKMFIKSRPCRIFCTFMSVTYSPNKISCTIVHRMLSPMKCFQNAKAYFAAAVSYARKMFIKSRPCRIFWETFRPQSVSGRAGHRPA